jgi:hypothetical protein
VIRVRLSRFLWIGAAAILVAAALVTVVAVLRGYFSENDGRILLTLAAVLYAGGMGLVGLGFAERGFGSGSDGSSPRLPPSASRSCSG